jgi:hypothetical protein
MRVELKTKHFKLRLREAAGKLVSFLGARL